MTKAQTAERNEAIDDLRKYIKPGDTVYTILDHVSSSGMSRAIRVLVPATNGQAVDFLHPNWAVGKALGLRHHKRNGYPQDALIMTGAGMDMGFALVYELSSVLYPEYECLGDNCPSPEHTNNRRRETCDCGHEAYNHERLDGLHLFGRCEQIECECKAFNRIPVVDHRGAGVRHRDGYALRHRWL